MQRAFWCALGSAACLLAFIVYGILFGTLMVDPLPGQQSHLAPWFLLFLWLPNILVVAAIGLFVAAIVFWRRTINPDW